MRWIRETVLAAGLCGLFWLAPASPAAAQLAAPSQQVQQVQPSPSPSPSPSPPTLKASPSTVPAPAPAATAANEIAPLRRDASAGAAGLTTQPAGTARPVAPQVEVVRVIVALAIVLSLVFALRWLYRRLCGGLGGSRPSQAVRVLGRNVISPRQQVLVLQVGRRVVVVGDSGQQMSPLCEITDADEVAELVGQLQGERVEPLARTFQGLFGRADAKYAVPPRSPFPAEDDDAPPRAGASDAGDVGDAAVEPNVVLATRGELDGLLDKVRGLQQQFRRP